MSDHLAGLPMIDGHDDDDRQLKYNFSSVLNPVECNRRKERRHERWVTNLPYIGGVSIGGRIETIRRIANTAYYTMNVYSTCYQHENCVHHVTTY